MAAYLDSQDRSADVVHRRIAICADRRIADLGEQSGASGRRLAFVAYRTTTSTLT